MRNLRNNGLNGIMGKSELCWSWIKTDFIVNVTNSISPRSSRCKDNKLVYKTMNLLNEQ
jgi:hypothetical protein